MSYAPAPAHARMDGEDSESESLRGNNNVDDNPASMEMEMQSEPRHQGAGATGCFGGDDEPPPQMNMAEMPQMTDEMMATPRGRVTLCEPELVQKCADSKYSCLVTLTNNTNYTLQLKSGYTDEKWVNPPPKRVPNGYEISFACNSNTMLCGVEAEVVYEVCVNDPHPNACLTIKVEVPAIGRNSAKVTCPEYVQCQVDKPKSDNPIISIELSSVHETAYEELRQKELSTPAMQRKVQRQAMHGGQSAVVNAAMMRPSEIPVVMGVAIGTPAARQPGQQGVSSAAAPSQPRIRSVEEVEAAVTAIKGLAEIVPEIYEASSGPGDETLDSFITELRMRMKELRMMLEECGDREQLIAALLEAYDLGESTVNQYSVPKNEQPEQGAPVAVKQQPAAVEASDLADILTQAPTGQIEAATDEPKQEAEPNAQAAVDEMLDDFDQLLDSMGTTEVQSGETAPHKPAPAEAEAVVTPH